MSELESYKDINEVLGAVEYEGTTAEGFLSKLKKGNVEIKEGTEFDMINGLGASFESFREEKGDEAFPCKESSEIEEFVKINILQAKIKVLKIVKFLQPGKLHSDFLKALKNNLDYDSVKSLTLDQLSDLWEKFYLNYGESSLSEEERAIIADRRAIIATQRAVIKEAESKICLQEEDLERLMSESEEERAIIVDRRAIIAKQRAVIKEAENKICLQEEDLERLMSEFNYRSE